MIQSIGGLGNLDILHEGGMWLVVGVITTPMKATEDLGTVLGFPSEYEYKD